MWNDFVTWWAGNDKTTGYSDIRCRFLTEEYLNASQTQSVIDRYMWETKITDLERAQLMMATRAILFPPSLDDPDNNNTDNPSAAASAAASRRTSVNKESKKAHKRASKMAVPVGFDALAVEKFRSWYMGGGFLITQVRE